MLWCGYRVTDLIYVALRLVAANSIPILTRTSGLSETGENYKSS